MMRHLVLGALIGFGAAVLLLAAFGTGGGLFPLPAPVSDAGVDAGLTGADAGATPRPERTIAIPQLRPVLAAELLGESRVTALDRDAGR